jgi:tRNA(adenine34) deaminase
MTRGAIALHELFMRMALAEAERALAEEEVPIGAVIVRDDRVIASAHNQREQLHDPTAHAEMIAITQAAGAIGDWRLEGCTLYVTLEPCPMCAGALVAARVGRLVFGAPDPKAGACGTLYNLCADPRLNHEITVRGGVQADRAAALLTAFFDSRRP